jgi:beta-galactosidase
MLLHGRNVSLLLLPPLHAQEQTRRIPEIVHWGRRLPDDIDTRDFRALASRAVARNAIDEDSPQATLFPTIGDGTFLAPALQADRDGQDWTADFVVREATFEGGAAVIKAVDDCAKISLAIHLALAPDDDVLTMRTSLVNTGTAPLHVAHLAAGVFLWPDRATELLTFDGYWDHEFTQRRVPFEAGHLAVENRRGRTSHDRFPALFAGTPGFTEDAGEVWAVQLGWSGNHAIRAQRLEDGRAVVTLGELLHPGEVILAPGATLEAPTAYATYSNRGLAGIARQFHTHIRDRVLSWPGGAMRPRPVTLNTWEGTYFAHDPARLAAQATAAAKLGIERFVLDDGWMNARDHDRAGLGDWVVDPRKYPQGLGPLARHVVAQGMEFGLWVEPEMVNPDSDLYRSHPNAVLHVAGRPLRTARHQLVLDLTRRDMHARIFAALDALLRELPIAYLKWDMNRDLLAAGDAQGRPAYRAQVLATYALIDKLRAAHPSVEIESCASGGGRADLGILARTHRVWTSDCTDALERLRIQRGASLILPPELLGTHVSAAPNHQAGRRHTLAFRAAVALFGHMGVELDPLALAAEETEELAAWITLHKRLRPLLHGGEHVAAPMIAGRSLRGVVASQNEQAAYLVAQESTPDRQIPAPVRLPGLQADRRYRLLAPAPQHAPVRATDIHRALFAEGISLSPAPCCAMSASRCRRFRLNPPSSCTRSASDRPIERGPMLGVCYYPEHWPESWWPDDARQMREMGITYVRIGEFGWSRLEPSPGRLDFAWLDRALDLLHAHRLRVVLCTPTATPPKWLIDRHPDILPVDEHGRVRGFGSRRHTTFSSEIWWQESRRITTLMAERYGRHPAVAGWQLDNEFGCHDTVLSYGDADRRAFHEWLRRRFQTPQRLNEAWGNVFWSMEANTFEEIPLPAGAVTETNPAARLDFQRFASDRVAAYARMQTEIIRAHAPGRFVTHNFMGRFVAFDHWQVGAELDFASWNSYPLGFTEQFPCTPTERAAFSETGHPDVAAFHHDLYRSVGRGRWWVMEQQPGPVNWAPWNAVPKPGMVRLWTWEALAHGAEVVSYFRWRQAPFAQEQMHAGLHRPDRARSPGGEEAAQVGQELARLGDLPEGARAAVALVFDYEAAWITRIQPQGADFNYVELCVRWYEAARRLGLDLDIVAPGAALAGYRAVLVPSLPYATPDALAAFQASDAVLLFGPRSGSKTRHFGIPAELPPGELQALLPIRVAQVASLRPGLTHSVSGAVAGVAERWREWVEPVPGTPLTTLASFADGTPALLHAGRAFYLAGWPDAALLAGVIRYVLAGSAGLATADLPPGIRLRRRGPWRFAFNRSDTLWTAPESDQSRYILGRPAVAPQGVACWREV